MSVKLYGNLVSQPCRAVAWLLRAKGVDFELVYARPPKRIPAELAEMNPSKMIPVLKDGAFSLFEGNAIMVYLAEKHGWIDVYPTDLHARAKVNEYLHWHHTNARLATLHAFAPLLRRSAGQATPADLESLKNKDAIIGKTVGILEKLLVKPYIAQSEQPTLADFACYCEMDQLEIMDVFDFSAYPKTAAWMQRMKSVPQHDEVRVPMREFLTKFKLIPA